jgi:hypothetical protein
MDRDLADMERLTSEINMGEARIKTFEQESGGESIETFDLTLDHAKEDVERKRQDLQIRYLKSFFKLRIVISMSEAIRAADKKYILVAQNTRTI